MFGAPNTLSKGYSGLCEIILGKFVIQKIWQKGEEVIIVRRLMGVSSYKCLRGRGENDAIETKVEPRFLNHSHPLEI